MSTHDEQYFIALSPKMSGDHNYGFWWCTPGNVIKSYTTPQGNLGGCWCCPLVDDTGMQYTWFPNRQLERVHVEE